jgi:hypothetical protein
LTARKVFVNMLDDYYDRAVGIRNSGEFTERTPNTRLLPERPIPVRSTE